MKRLIVLMVAAVLVLGIACAAAADGEVFTTPYFSMKLPEGWEVDYESKERKEGEECLGFFGGPEEIGLICGAYLIYYENLRDIALWNADEEELQAYTEAILEDYKDNNPELIGIVMAGKIPFVVIKGTDEDGDFVYADTMTNGNAIEFMFYVTDYDGEKQYPITDEYIEQIRTVLTGFEPAA